MAGDKSFLPIIVLRLERIVYSATKAGIAGVQGGRFLVEKSIGKVQQEAVRIAMLELRLECVAASMTKVPKTHQEIPQPWERLAGQVRGRVVAVANINGIAGRSSIAYRCAKWNIAGWDLVQVHTPDQPAQRGSQVGKPDRRIAG